jgi:hypothetical protein
MAAKQSGDSKQGLIIALVCFVLLSIILGVTTYMGYDGQAAEKAKAKDADTKAQANKKTSDEYKYRALETQFRMGRLKADSEEGKDLQAMRQSPPAGISTDFQGVVQAWDKEYKNDKGVLETADARAQRLTSERNDANIRYATSEANLKKLQDQYKEQLATRDADLDDLRKKIVALQAQNVKDSQQLAAGYDQKLAQLEEVSRQYEKMKRDVDNDTTAREKQAKKLQDDVRRLEDTRDKLKARIEGPDFLKSDMAKGKIIALDTPNTIGGVNPPFQSNRSQFTPDADTQSAMAYINLGSSQGIRPQQNLTFSIFSPGLAGKPGKEYKGSLEVIKVIGPNVSKAKITQTAGGNRNPIMVGDMLVNPAWNPNQPEHIAIAGLIDLTGDQRNNIDEFIRNMQRQGVVVDAYLDLADNTIKGPGMNLNTSYLVIGDTPDLTVEMIPGDKRIDQKLGTSAKIAEMRSDAQKLGVTTVPLRHFVELIGYKLPKGAGVARRFGYESPLQQPKSTPESGEKKDNSDK